MPGFGRNIFEGTIPLRLISQSPLLSSANARGRVGLTCSSTDISDYQQFQKTCVEQPNLSFACSSQLQIFSKLNTSPFALHPSNFSHASQPDRLHGKNRSQLSEVPAISLPFGRPGTQSANARATLPRQRSAHPPTPRPLLLPLESLPRRGESLPTRR